MAKHRPVTSAPQMASFSGEAKRRPENPGDVSLGPRVAHCAPEDDHGLGRPQAISDLNGPTFQVLNGGRLHLSHGPIDVVLKAFGDDPEVARAHCAAAARFRTILPELCAELPALRAASGSAYPRSPVGHRMAEACRPFADVFVTPMAAVAGAVADELLGVMCDAAKLSRAYVNDGGDIAVFVAPRTSLDIGMFADFTGGAIPNRSGWLRVSPGDGVGGIATSGARGRSLSLGIADSVTVLAADAATADVAATLIANAVNCDDRAIARRPAVELDPDSDLGERLVTVSVGLLAPSRRSAALAAGLSRAREYATRGLIVDAALTLQGETVTLRPAANATQHPHAGAPSRVNRGAAPSRLASLAPQGEGGVEPRSTNGASAAGEFERIAS